MNFVQPIRSMEKIEEVKAILRRRSGRDYLLFVLGINTGLRISDLLKLKVSDARNVTHITIKEQKTGKVKRFKLNSVAVEAIAEYIKGLDGETYLFSSQRTKKPITRIQAYRILNETAAKAGLKEIGTHTMRKTFGFHFYNKTKDVVMLQQLFNHSAPSVTMRYIGISQDMLDFAMDNFSL